MRLPLFQVDAFASRPFEGNPAAVMPLDSWLPDATMQSLAAENNLSETAFLVSEGPVWRIRWFTPTYEIDLCGHATVAAAHILFTEVYPSLSRVDFRSASGPLSVTRTQGSPLLTLDFPSRPPLQVPVPPGVEEALGSKVVWAGKARDLMLVLESEEAVRTLSPDFAALSKIDAFGIVATAPAIDDATDFVSRCFFPREGIFEDPVTGSAHCTLAPYWGAKLERMVLRARQLSLRGGTLLCELRDDRVLIGGTAVTVLRGEFFLP